MAEFLHGVETVEVQSGPRPVREVKTAIIGIVGTAPIHHASEGAQPDTLVKLLSDRDAPRLTGPDLAGYTIPAALASIWKQGGVTVLVVNVFDPAAHKQTVAPASLPITNAQIALVDADIITVSVETAAAAPCVEGTDYAIDKIEGVITVIAGGALDGETTATVGYDHGDPAAVLSTDIIGGVDINGVRTGAEAWLDAQSVFGFGPKLLIAPGYSGAISVTSALQVLADKLRAIALADVPAGSSRDDVIAGRGTSGSLDLTVADKRVVYCFPHLESLVDGAAVLEPLSPYLAGVTARTDADVGYWRSPSNRKIVGPSGLEVPLTAAIADPQCDVNQLNAAGVLTVFSGYGQGLKTWGNRSSLFPGQVGIETFIPVQRVIDVVEESIELASLAHLDGPISSVFIEAVLADVQTFMRLLVSRGALLPGSRVEYFDADNPPAELALGHIVFTRTFLPPPPAERITYRSVLDTNLLQLGG